MTKGSIDEGVVYHAGFPNAAEDQSGGGLSLDALVVRRRASTFFWRLEAALPEFGWTAGTLLVVDRALTPRSGDVTIVVADGAFELMRHRSKGLTTEYSLWGVVTYAVEQVRA